MKEKLKVKNSPIHNIGVFALENIKKSETICIMRGKEKTIEELKKDLFFKKLNRENIHNPLQISNNSYLILKKPYIFINHSCNPNSAIIEKNKLIAIKNIKKNDEITYDYSVVSWETMWNISNEKKYEFKMPCNCKSKKCRKIIKEFPYLNKKIKEYYIKNNYLPDFIKQKLNHRMQK